MQYTLDNCEMKKLLAKKRSNNKAEYLSILSLIEKPAEEILEYTKTNFPNYTDHTIKHSYRILDYLYHILNENIKKDLSATELFCLILAAMLHDIGMSNSDGKDIQTIRNEHAKLSKEIIPRFFDELKIVSGIQRVVHCVAYVCESHTKDIQQMYSEAQFVKKDMINGELVRYGYLAILLRIGDLLDMEEGRTSYIVRALFPEYYKREDSLKHHERCNELESFIYTDKSIEVIVKTFNRENFRLWTNWFAYLKNEITQANTYYLRDYAEGESLPKFEYILESAVGANFCTEEIRFEIDDKGALWKIISNSIYTAEYDYLRELTQNAIDACLMKCYLNKKNVLRNAYPRVWPMNDYRVNILFSESTNELIVHDNGIGMDMNTLKRYLFKTADSGYRHINVEREFLFPAIAKFGIGFVACLTKADNIRIYTQGKATDEEIAVEIEKDSNIAFIERKKGTGFQGTVIILRLKASNTYQSICNFLQGRFLSAAVRIELINLDILRNLYGEEDYEYDLSGINEILQKKKQCDNNLRDLNIKNNAINNIISACDTLRYKLQEISSDEVFPLDEIYERHKAVIKLLKERTDLVGNELLISMGKFTKNTIDTKYEEYIKILDDIISELSRCQKGTFGENIKKHLDLALRIGDTQRRIIMKEDVCIAYLSADFLVEDISCNIDAERVKNNLGIIFIKTEYINEEVGIEFSIVNPFLFYNGELTANLINVRGSKQLLSDEEENTIISLNDLYDIEYQLSLEFEGREEEENYYRQIRELEREKYSYNVDVLFCDEDIKVLRDINSSRVDYHELEGGTLFLTSDIYNKSYRGELLPVFKKKSFCQDGIAIDCDISSLIPLKVGYYDCNLFGDSRLELNVTRHDINRDNTLINRWMEQSGKLIQKAVIDNVKNTLDRCGINKISLKDYMKVCDNEVFEKCAYKQFEKLV